MNFHLNLVNNLKGFLVFSGYKMHFMEFNEKNKQLQNIFITHGTKDQIITLQNSNESY